MGSGGGGRWVRVVRVAVWRHIRATAAGLRAVKVCAIPGMVLVFWGVVPVMLVANMALTCTPTAAPRCAIPGE